MNNFITFGSMFDTTHLLYIFISLGITVGSLYLASRIKQQKYKDIYLKSWALATVFLHISPVWLFFLRGEPALVADNILFPIYFCNMSMYFLLVVSLWGNKTTKMFKYMATVAAYAGAFGALISLLYPEYYLASLGLEDWGVLKSMLSHSTMLIGSLYLFVGGYVKIEKQNILVYAIGLLFFGLIGVIVNGVFALAGLPEPNAMFMQHPPIEDVPFLNFYVIAIMMMIVVSSITIINELINNRKKAAKSALIQ